MDAASITEQARKLAEGAAGLAGQAAQLAGDAVQLTASTGGSAEGFSFVALFTIFVLACFVGYFVVWSVTPALHSPLMGVTNAISSVIIVGALIAAGPAELNFSQVLGLIAVGPASVNILGGFIVTQRLLQKFKKHKK